MESVKDILKFCNAAVFYDYTNISIMVELNQVRKGIINKLYRTFPDNGIHVSLSMIDDKILKINDNDIENNIHYLRKNILYMLSFEKLIRDEQQIVRPILNDDHDRE